MEQHNSSTGNRNVKDSLFCSLFSDKDNALSLYNAINGTNYTDTEQLEMMTVENTVYLGYNEDASFVVDSALAVYEHQSTLNPNMPIRILLYMADVYKRYIEIHGLQKQLYGETYVPLPAPQAIVFYNGQKDNREKYELRLSDCFEKSSCIELKVKVLNINIDKNRELMGRCRILNEYSLFVDCLRTNVKKYRDMSYNTKEAYSMAVDAAVNYCIENEILREYLIKNRKEVGSMALSDVTIEDYGEVRYEEGREEGREEERIHIIERIKSMFHDETTICSMIHGLGYTDKDIEAYERYVSAHPKHKENILSEKELTR